MPSAKPTVLPAKVLTIDGVIIYSKLGVCTVVPATVTFMVPLPAPRGIVILNVVALAVFTVQALPFSVTALLKIVVLKSTPVINTVVFFGPEVGFMLDMARLDVGAGGATGASSFEQLAINIMVRNIKIMFKFFICGVF